MAIQTPKKPSRKPTKGAPIMAGDTPVTSSANTQKAGSSDLVPMNFAVPAEFHQDFKLFATMHKMSMVDVLKESFELYKQQKGA